VYIPEGFANVRYVFALSGIQDEMSFAIGVSPPTGMTTPEIAVAADAAFAAAGFGGELAMCVGWSYLGTRVTRKFGGQPVVADYPLSVAGSVAVATIPPNCAMLIKKNTALGGRHGRGRLFVPPFNLREEYTDNAGYLTPAVQASQQAAWSLFLEALDTNALGPRLFHTDPVALPTTITSLQVTSQLGTQRRRMR
jgi:hypothetical protein